MAGPASPELARFLEVARNYSWFADGDAGKPPVPIKPSLNPDDPLARLRVGPEFDGILVIEEDMRPCELDYCVVFYGVGIGETGLPERCLVDTKRTDALAALSKANGVTLITLPESDAKVSLPPDIAIVGSAASIATFAFAVFETGILACSTPTRE